MIVPACGQEVSGAPLPAAAGPAVCDTVVMFVLDVSLSMEATDVPPTRLAVAREAAREFANRQPAQTDLGLATFAGTAQLHVTPTTNRSAFTTALDAVKLSERTATGEGIYTALAALSQVVPVDGPQRIILLSDGKQTQPADLDAPRGAYTAAREAQSKNIPISTISLGTAHGVVDVPDHSTSVRVPVPTDPDSLREIARLSGGDFHSATTLPELSAALAELTCSA